MNEANGRALDFHLVPRSLFDTPTFMFTQDRMAAFVPYKLGCTSDFGRAITQLLEAEAAPAHAASQFA